MTPPEVRVFRHIDEIDPALWDQPLGADDLQASHRFVSACQRSGVEDATYRHVLVLRGGRAVGTASLFRMEVSLDLLGGAAIRHTARVVRKVWRPFLRLPVMFCGLPVSFGASCIRAADRATPAWSAPPCRPRWRRSRARRTRRSSA